MQPFREVRKRVILLFITGILLFLLFSRKTKPTGAYYYSDMLFMICSVYLCAGLYCLVRNLGMFNTFKYGMRQFFNILRGKKDIVHDKMEGGYLEYVHSRTKVDGAKWMFLFSAVFFAISVAVSFFG